MATPTAFLSYNSTGLNEQKCDWIRDLCNLTGASYVSIQEHFRKPKTTDKLFSDEFPDYNSYVIPGYREKNVDRGRPKAGLAQLSDKNLAIKKDRVQTKNFRIQAQVLNFPKSRLLWLNTYLPTDPMTVNDFYESELVSVLSEVEMILDKTMFDDCVWAGDLNWQKNTAFPRHMESLWSDWDCFQSGRNTQWSLSTSTQTIRLSLL